MGVSKIDAARILGISQEEVSARIAQGTLKAKRTGHPLHGPWSIDLEDQEDMVDKLVEQELKVKPQEHESKVKLQEQELRAKLREKVETIQVEEKVEEVEEEVEEKVKEVKNAADVRKSTPVRRHGHKSVETSGEAKRRNRWWF